MAFYHYVYNSASLTRHYDERTYEMDMRVLEMFRTLLEGNAVQPIAVRSKEDAVFARAFWNGRGYYSSTAFKQRFVSFRDRISSLNEMTVVKGCMAAACRGWYQPAIRMVFLLFRVKRLIKCVKSNIS